MKNAKHDGFIQRAVTALRTDEPTVELKSYASAGPQLARVVIDVTHTSASRKNPALVMEAISRKLQGRFQAVAASFELVSSGSYTDRLTGVVGKTREIVAVEPSVMKGFRAMASNMFMDEEKDMWALKRTEAGDVLVKTSAEDDLSLLNLLEATASAGHRSSPEYSQLRAVCSAIANHVEGGQYVSYVDLNNSLAVGFVLATTDEGDAVVLQNGADDVDVIKREAVTDIHDDAEIPEPTMTAEEQIDHEVALSSGRVDLSNLISFYKKVYAYAPKYFAELERRIRQHQFC